MVFFDNFRIYSIYPERGDFKNGHHTIRGSTSNLTSKSLKTQNMAILNHFKLTKCKFSYKAGLESGWMVFSDTFRIYSIYPERKELWKWTSYDSIVKNSKYGYFEPFQINKVQIFIQGWAGKWLPQWAQIANFW